MAILYDRHAIAMTGGKLQRNPSVARLRSTELPYDGHECGCGDLFPVTSVLKVFIVGAAT